MQLKATQLKTLLLGFTLGLLPMTVAAGSDHDHSHDHGHSHSHSHAPVNQVTAKDNATKIVLALVERDKLEKGWATVAASSIEKITPQGNPEWLVIFVNEKITDADKQKLYVFLTLGGDYIAANFTGK